MRSMSEILADEPSLHKLPDSEEGDPPAEADQGADEGGGATPEPAAAKKPESKPKQQAKPAADDDDESDKIEPGDFAGALKALKAVRGDKRKERNKWHEAERKLAELQGRHQALEQMQRQPPPQAQGEAPDPDDEFYKLGPGRYYETREQAKAAKSWTRDVLDRRELMLATRDDFADAEKAFMQAAQANPVLGRTFNEQPTPTHAVLYAYQHGKQMLQVQQYGANTVDELREAIRAEERARMEAEMAPGGAAPEAEESTPRPTAKPIPRSIASARGSGAVVTKAWSGPRPMADILR